MRARTRLVEVALVGVATPMFLGVAAVPARAADGIQLTHYLADTLAASTRPATVAQGLSAERVRAFLDDAAANGRLVDVSRVRVATVDDPAAGQVDVVWDDAATPQYLGVTDGAGRTAGSGQVGLGVVFSQSAVEPSPLPDAAGLGYEAGFGLNGLYKYGNTGCRTVYYTPKYGHTSDHWSTQCYEKFARSNATNWVYNRWGLWNRGTPTNYWHAWTIDFTIRARPWRGQEYKVVALDGWTPASGNNDCTAQANFTLNAGPASLQIPIHRCSTTTVLPDATKHGMGMDWNGKSEHQLYEDFGMAIRANNTSTVPIMADYLWAEVQYCGSGEAECWGADPSQYLVDKDSGWDSANGSGPDCDLNVVTDRSATIGGRDLMTPCH